MSRRLCCFAWLLAAAASVSGCGNNAVPAESDADAACDALHTVLEAWKNGEDVESLQELDPPLYFSDVSLERGAKLDSYTLDPQTKRFGLSVICTATLMLRDQEGTTSQKTVNYQIDTQEAVVIVQGDP